MTYLSLLSVTFCKQDQILGCVNFFFFLFRLIYSLDLQTLCVVYVTCCNSEKSPESINLKSISLLEILGGMTVQDILRLALRKGDEYGFHT